MRCTISALTYFYLSVYPNYVAVYTDGSFIQGSGGCSFMYEDEVFEYHLDNYNSIHAAKL
jgi:hypothetical protein